MTTPLSKFLTRLLAALMLVLCFAPAAEARWYRADLGVWMNRDPIGYKGGLSLYAYVDSRPVMAVDPTGLIAMQNTRALGSSSSCGSSGCGSFSGSPSQIPVAAFSPVPVLAWCLGLNVTRQDCETCCGAFSGDSKKICLQTCKQLPDVYPDSNPYCKDACGDPGDRGRVVCTPGGTLIVCICDRSSSPLFPEGYWAKFRRCVIIHEGENWRARECAKSPETGKQTPFEKDRWICTSRCNERDAYLAQMFCVMSIQCDAGDTACEEQKNKHAELMKKSYEATKKECEECSRAYPRQ